MHRPGDGIDDVDRVSVIRFLFTPWNNPVNSACVLIAGVMVAGLVVMAFIEGVW